MFIPVHQDLDSVVYETQIRLFRKDSHSTNAIAPKERLLKMTVTTSKHETSIIHTDPSPITEVPIQLRLKHKMNDFVTFSIEPTTALIDGLLMIGSHSWLRDKIFSLNLPEDVNLQRGLEVTVFSPAEHECTSMFYKAPVAFVSDSTKCYDNGAAQIHLRAHTGPTDITRPEVIECKVDGSFDCHIYRPLIGFPRIACNKVEISTATTYQSPEEMIPETTPLTDTNDAAPKASYTLPRNDGNSFASEINQCNETPTILERRVYSAKKVNESTSSCTNSNVNTKFDVDDGIYESIANLQRTISNSINSEFTDQLPSTSRAAHQSWGELTIEIDRE